MHVNTADLR